MVVKDAVDFRKTVHDECAKHQKCYTCPLSIKKFASGVKGANNKYIQSYSYECFFKSEKIVADCVMRKKEVLF